MKQIKVSLTFTKDLHKAALAYAKKYKYKNLQELCLEALREKLFKHETLLNEIKNALKVRL